MKLQANYQGIFLLVECLLTESMQDMLDQIMVLSVISASLRLARAMYQTDIIKGIFGKKFCCNDNCNFRTVIKDQ